MGETEQKASHISHQPKYVRGYFWKTRLRNILIWALEIAVAAGLAFCCAYFFGQQITIGEDSMQQTLMPGDKVLINTAAYFLEDPKRGDLVAFYSRKDDESSLQVKRIIGLPGEKILISDGIIYIDGQVYDEKGAYPDIANAGMAAEEIVLDSDEYFVLGDNRNNSEDSRHIDVGPVQKENLVGKLWLRISPLESFGLVE